MTQQLRQKLAISQLFIGGPIPNTHTYYYLCVIMSAMYGYVCMAMTAGYVCMILTAMHGTTHSVCWGCLQDAIEDQHHIKSL